jgi:hypothetical protein
LLILHEEEEEALLLKMILYSGKGFERVHVYFGGLTLG